MPRYKRVQQEICNSTITPFKSSLIEDVEDLNLPIQRTATGFDAEPFQWH
jgi:hypothetical protein